METTSQSQHPEHERGTYVLSCDLATRVRALRQVGLKTPSVDDTIFNRFYDGLTQKIRVALPKDDLRVVKMEDLAEEILAVALMRQVSLKKATVVSSCLEMATPRRGHTIEMNRIIDISGEIIGWGPRPGHPTLDEQLDAIATVPQPIVLIEDGAFSGKTLSYVLSKMRHKGIDVNAVVIGIGFLQALTAIRKEFGGEIIVVEQMERIVDWMPDHDFIPFTPNCGRVFGFPMNGDALPFYTYNGASYSVPYIMPFLSMKDMEKWTGIPAKDCRQISLFCIQLTTDLFFQIEQLTGKQVRISDLMGMQPAISIPITLGQQTFPRLDERVIDYLADICHRKL
jgi:hypothetical protein